MEEMKTKKLNKSEIETNELKNQVRVLKNACDQLDKDKQELIKRNINLSILMHHTVKELSTILHSITTTLPTIT
jgi:23S rRNA maturation mini-RNase III